jgi:Flp pilus assembly protein TadD
MSVPPFSVPPGASGLGDVVGDAASKSRLKSLSGTIGRSARGKASKVETITRHLRKALNQIGDGQAAKAVDTALAALEHDERYGLTWHVLGIALEKSGQLDKAFEAYGAAVQLLPDDVALTSDLGSLAHRLGHLDLAEKLYDKCLALSPGEPNTTNNLACVLRDGNRYGEAIDLLKPVVGANPTLPLLWNTLGTIVSDQGDMAGSIVFYEEAIRLDPGFYKARYNLANVRTSLGEPEQALVDIDAALVGVKEPSEVATMRMAKALTQLMLGHLEDGFETYEARFDPALSDAVTFQDLGERWTPETDLTGKTLMVYGEQGLGDEILFANLLGDVVEAVGPEGQVILAIEGRLAPLFQRSYPTVRVHPHRTVAHLGRLIRFVEFDGEAPHVDVWAPLGSLFRRFRNREDQFPAKPAFLTADPARVAHWRGVLNALGPEPKVGVVWKSLNMKGSRARGFTPFDLWRPVFETPGVQFVNLQYGDASAELAQAQALGLNLWTPPGIDLKADLDDVAALSSALDLVVAPMTATTNIAAACGAPAWVVSMPDAWPRFGTDRFPCYPSVRLFPADGYGDWEGVMGRIKTALEAQVAGDRRLSTDAA